MVRSPAKTLFAAWLIPGAGHWLLGHRRQAIVFFLAVVPAFLLGLWLTDFSGVSPVRHRFYYLAHILCGLPTLLTTWLTSGIVLDQVPRHLGMSTQDIGLVYSAVASLLNLVVMMDAYAIVADLKRPHRAGADEAAPATTAGEVS